jgi:uncharacterized protein involved in outer membrane biogenesis
MTDLSSRGNTMTRLLQNLNGKTTIAFKEGHIRDSQLAEQVALAVKLFEKKEMKGDKTVVTFTGLSGDWQTTQGVFKTDNFKLLSPYFIIKGAGTADVVQKALDMKVRISQASNEAVFAPLHIFGPFSALKFKLELEELLKSLAKEDFEKAKRDAKEKLKQRLKEEVATREEEIRAKFEEEKQRALDKLKNQIGEKATDEIQKQLKDNIGDQLEEQIKDRLKDGLKNWF